MRPSKWWRTVASIGIVLVLQAHSMAADRSTSGLDRGFQLLYNLDFAAAQQEFVLHQREHPQDPLGPTSEAAGLLFAELDRLGILDSAFFNHSSRPRVTPTLDPLAYKQFDSALQRAEAIARSRLNRDAEDRDALFALMLGAGLRADYTALIQHCRGAALHHTKDATNSAQHLLGICPDCYDAYVATGISQYLIGTMSAPVRWVLRFGGFNGNKRGGIADLQLAAERGHYLAPFARIVLVIVYAREKQLESARQVLATLHTDFPRNPLFTQEIARIDSRDRRGAE